MEVGREARIPRGTIKALCFCARFKIPVSHICELDQQGDTAMAAPSRVGLYEWPCESGGLFLPSGKHRFHLPSQG